jgi:AsmA protein
MKPLALGLGAVLTIAALSGAIAPWTISGHAIRLQVIAQVRDTTGLSASPPTRVTFSLLPRPRLKLETIFFHDDAGAASISAKVAKGDLRLLDLVAGKIELSSITLFEPKISLDLDQASPLSAAFMRRSTEDGQGRASTLGLKRLALVRIVDGRIALRSARRDFVTQIDDVNAKLDWRSVDAPASLTASGLWRGHETDVTAWLGDPAALMRGEASPLKLSGQTDLLSAKFDGLTEAGRAWRFEGRTDASTPAARSLARWISPAVPGTPEVFGAAALSGRMIANAEGLAFSDFTLSANGSDFDGEAALRLAPGRPVLSATLASDALFLTPYFVDLPPLLDSSGSWSAASFPQNFGPLDLDIRVSAAHAKFDRIELSDVGLALLLENDRLYLSLPQARLYGGNLEGQATLTRAPGAQSISASADFTNIEAGTLLWDAADCDALNGSASGDFTIEGGGDSPLDLVRGLSGHAEFNVQRGEIVGIDFEQALRRVAKRPLSVATGVHGGRTTFDQFSGKFLFGEDKAELRGVQLSGPGARVEVSGATLLGERALDIQAVAQQADADGAPSPDGSRLALKVEGDWDNPRLVLDVDSLLRRSEAAAPLFAPASAASR